jgi:hypothetical protein
MLRSLMMITILSSQQLLSTDSFHVFGSSLTTPEHVNFASPHATSPKVNGVDPLVPRSQVLESAAQTLAVTLVLLLPSRSEAKEDASLKGTKKDPLFEACLSSCLYECTKPKGEQQKSRSECFPGCKKSCATTGNLI